MFCMFFKKLRAVIDALHSQINNFDDEITNKQKLLANLNDRIGIAEEMLKSRKLKLAHEVGSLEKDVKYWEEVKRELVKSIEQSQKTRNMELNFENIAFKKAVDDAVAVWKEKFALELETKYRDFYQQISAQTIADMEKVNKHLLITVDTLSSCIRQPANIAEVETEKVSI